MDSLNEDYKDLHQQSIHPAIYPPPPIYLSIHTPIYPIIQPSNNQTLDQQSIKTSTSRDFPGGAMVKNLLASAGDTGSSPGPGKPHMPQSNKARAPQLLKPTRLEPMFCSKRSHRKEKPTHCNED